MARRAGLEARHLRVAGLIVIGLLLLIYGVYQVGKIFDVFAERYTVVTLMPSVAGLREGSMVTLAGQQIGQVDDIEFIPVRQKRAGQHLTVRLKVAERAREQIRQDSKVQVRSLGLLGDKYIDIQPGSASVAVLQQGDTLPAEITMDTEQFLTQASHAVEQANLVVADLRVITGSLARGEGTMGQLIHDQQLYFRMVSATSEMQTLLEQINSGEGALGRMIQDPEMYQRMVSAVARVDSLGTGILHGDGTLAQMIRSDSLYRGMAGTAAKADHAAGELSALLQRLNQTDGSLNRLMTDPRLFDEFLKSVIDLQSLIADVREHPKKYVPPVNVKVF